MDDIFTLIHQRARIVDITTTLTLDKMGNYVETSKKQTGWVFLATRVKASENLFQPPWLLNSFFYRRPDTLLIRRGYEAYVNSANPPTTAAMERFFKSGNPCGKCKESHYTNSFCRACGAGLCTRCYLEDPSNNCGECNALILTEAQAPCVLLDPTIVGAGSSMTGSYGMTMAEMRLDVEALHGLIVEFWATMPSKRRVQVVKLDEIKSQISEDAISEDALSCHVKKPAKGEDRIRGTSVESLTKVRSASLAAGWQLWPDERSWDQSASVLSSDGSTFFIVLRDTDRKLCKLYWFRQLRRRKTVVMGSFHVCNGCGSTDTVGCLTLCPGCQAVGYCSKKCGRHDQRECAMLQGRGFTKSLGGASATFEIKAFARPQSARSLAKESNTKELNTRQ